MTQNKIEVYCGIMFNRLSIPVILLLLLHCLLSPVYAVTDSVYHTVHFDKEHGLPTNNVYSTLQDHNGYMWVATDKGVLKYNGYSFKTFTTADGLPSNDIWRLYEDANGRMWLFNYSYEIGYIKNDVYKTIIKSDIDSKCDGIISVKGVSILVFDHYLYIVDAEDWFIRIIPPRIIPPLSLEKFYPGYDNVLYSLGVNKKMYVYNLKNGRGNISEKCSIGLDELFATALFAMLDNGRIIGYQYISNKVWVYDTRICKYNEIVLTDHGADKDENVTLLIKLEEIAGYAIFSKKAIYVVNKEMNVVSRQLYSDLLPGVNYLSYYSTDKLMNTWLTTSNAGLWLKMPVISLFSIAKTNPALYGTSCTGSTKNGTTYWWDNTKLILYGIGRGQNIILKKHFEEQVLNVSEADDSTLNIGFRRSYYQYDLKHSQIKDVIYAHPVSTRAYVIGEERSKVTKAISDSLKRFYINSSIFIDQYNRNVIYMGTKSHIAKIHLYKDSSVFENLKADRITTMFYDSANNFYWAYSGNSVNVVFRSTDKVLNIRADITRLLGIGVIRDIASDKYYNIYVLSDNKLFVFNTQTLKSYCIILGFDYTDGEIAIYNDVLVLAGKPGLAYAVIKSKEHLGQFKMVLNPLNVYYEEVKDLVINTYGTVYLNTDRGVFTFPIDSMQLAANYNYPDSRGFTKLVVKYTGNTLNISNRDSIQLSVGENRFNFDCINFYGEGTPLYKYRVNNGKWETTVSGEVQLDMNPDQYYKVECLVSDATSKTNKYILYVMQAPYWWQTKIWQRIFWGTGILLLIGLSVLIVLITRYFSAKANEKKQALTDLELRALYAQINPHFIFNTLVTAQYFINGNKMKEAYAHINKFSRLLRSYLKASGNRYANLGEEIDLLKDYIELQQVRFENKFNYAIEVDNKVAKDSMLIPSLLLQPLVENAINHGLFHLPEGEIGFLRLQFLQGASSEELICMIEDNGVGRQRSKEINSESTLAKDASYGTTLTKKLIDIFKEYEKMNIYLEYIDKPSPETGTIVKLTIGNIKYVA